MRPSTSGKHICSDFPHKAHGLLKNYSCISTCSSYEQFTMPSWSSPIGCSTRLSVWMRTIKSALLLLCCEAMRLWIYALSIDAILWAAYLPGTQNQLADKSSHQLDPHEWSHDSVILQDILARWGEPMSSVHCSAPSDHIHRDKHLMPLIFSRLVPLYFLYTFSSIHARCSAQD